MHLEIRNFRLFLNIIWNIYLLNPLYALNCFSFKTFTHFNLKKISEFNQFKPIQNMENSTKKTNTIDRKDFLKQVGTGFGAIILMNCIQACSSSEIPDPTPPVVTGKLDFTVDINMAANAALKTKGGFIVNKDKNVIIARTNDDAFIAVSSKCTHQQVELAFKGAANNFECPLHGSQFDTTGKVTKGPAGSALTKYNTTFTANTGVVRIFE